MRDNPTKLTKIHLEATKFKMYLQGCEDQEDGEVDLDDKSDIGPGEGIGEEGNAGEDEGGEEHGEEAAEQGSAQADPDHGPGPALGRDPGPFLPTSSRAGHMLTPSTEYWASCWGPL